MSDVFRGVTAVAYSKHGLSVYTAGADGMVCRIDASDGSVLGKFRSSSKAISALAVSSGVSTVLWLLDLRLCLLYFLSYLIMWMQHHYDALHGCIYPPILG
jgi:hypothetical protein